MTEVLLNAANSGPRVSPEVEVKGSWLASDGAAWSSAAVSGGASEPRAEAGAGLLTCSMRLTSLSKSCFASRAFFLSHFKFAVELGAASGYTTKAGASNRTVGVMLEGNGTASAGVALMSAAVATVTTGEPFRFFMTLIWLVGFTF